MTHVDTKWVTLSVAGDSKWKRLMTHKKEKEKENDNYSSQKANTCQQK